MLRIRLIAVAVCSMATLGHSAEGTPRFEAADVHNSPRETWPSVKGPFSGSGRFELRFATVLDLIGIAYDATPEKVFGGPSWLEIDRFDIVAVAPAASTAASLKLMLRTLLSERFKLVLHDDTRPMAAYALVSGGHPKLKEADGSGESSCSFTREESTPALPQTPGAVTLPVLLYTCRNTSMARFAEALPSVPRAASYLGKKLVVDRTELRGLWDFSLRFTPKAPASTAVSGDNIPIFEAIEDQLGLQLRESTVPTRVLVVDTVNEKPTDNSPVEMRRLPAPPKEFEVASLKPSAPEPSDGRGRGKNEVSNGRLHLPGITLEDLIFYGWNIQRDDGLAGEPKWMKEDRYEIDAKAPPGAATEGLTPDGSAASVNIDAFRPMLRALVEERFKLVAHTENRLLNSYVLVAKNPRLEKSVNPMSRSEWHEGAPPDAKNAKTSLARVVTCQNVTMSQFAELLPSIAPAYLDSAVFDATGLKGRWDFSFSFVPAAVAGAGAGVPREAGGAASNPSVPT